MKNKQTKDSWIGAARHSLGVMYFNGESLPKDLKEAAKWFRLAADQGHATSQFNLGAMYENDLGVPQDFKEALKWFRLAADQGHATAKLALNLDEEVGLNF